MNLTNIIGSYLYQEYSDDENLQGFIDAYNTYAQQYLNTFVNLNLPIYTNSLIVGALLDWVALGIYGMVRPSLPVQGAINPAGDYNTFPYNEYPYNYVGTSEPVSYYGINDDIFKRMITWNFYKGDGFQYTTTWLKRRVYRFLYGANGVDPGVQETYAISVAYSRPNNVTITVPDLPIAPLLNSAIQAQVLDLPMFYEYTIAY